MAGKPVHFEIAAKDTNRAQEFYKGMFGWQFQGMEGPTEYHMTQLGDDAGAAVFPGDPGATGSTSTSTTSMPGAARVQARRQGGRPQPVPGMGWSSTRSSTEGNAIGLWQTDPSAA